MRYNILLAFSFLFCFGVSASYAGYKPGDKATDFSLKNVDGQMVSLSSLPNTKGFIIVFTCNHCPYAKAYEDRIMALDNKYKSLGYPVVAINPSDPIAEPMDSYDAMKVRAQEKQYSFPYLLDEGQKIYPQYGAVRTPHVFVLEKTNDGNIVRYTGAIDDNYKNAVDVKEKYVEAVVDALLQHESLPYTSTKAIGCTIKVKKSML